MPVWNGIFLRIRPKDMKVIVVSELLIYEYRLYVCVCVCVCGGVCLCGRLRYLFTSVCSFGPYPVLCSFIDLNLKGVNACVCVCVGAERGQLNVCMFVCTCVCVW